MTANKDINIKAMKNGRQQQLIKNKQVAGVIGLFFYYFNMGNRTRVSRTGVLRQNNEKPQKNIWLLMLQTFCSNALWVHPLLINGFFFTVSFLKIF